MLQLDDRMLLPASLCHHLLNPSSPPASPSTHHVHTLPFAHPVSGGAWDGVGEWHAEEVGAAPARKDKGGGGGGGGGPPHRMTAQEMEEERQRVRAQLQAEAKSKVRARGGGCLGSGGGQAGRRADLGRGDCEDRADLGRVTVRAGQCVAWPGRACCPPTPTHCQAVQPTNHNFKTIVHTVPCCTVCVRASGFRVTSQ